MLGLVRGLLSIAIGLTAAACGDVGTGQTSSDGVKPEQVRQYLLEHPELILNDPEITASISRARAQRERAIAASRRESILDERADLLNSTLTPSSGATDADVTILEFYDYQCPPCITSHPELEKVKAAKANVRIVFAQLPTYGSHSIMAARAAIAAQRQGRFDAFHAALMTANAPLDTAALYATAAEVGLDVERLRADMRDPEVLRYLEEVRALAEALEVTGTPAFLVGHEILSGGITAEDLTAAMERQHP